MTERTLAGPPNERGIASSTLKIVAIIGMTANHGGLIFASSLPFPVLCLLLACGGVTFPIMAFLLVEGYRRTSNVGRYAARLLGFALVAQIPYQLFLSSNLNVLFTLLIGLALLYVHDHGIPFPGKGLPKDGDAPQGTLRRAAQSKVAFWIVLAVGMAASFFCDWGVLGPVMILLGYLLPTRAQRVALPLILAALSIGIPQASELVAGSLSALPYLLYAFVGCALAAPLLLSYHGSRGLPMKYFFYTYYPLHILVLGIAHLLLFGVTSA